MVVVLIQVIYVDILNHLIHGWVNWSLTCDMSMTEQLQSLGCPGAVHTEPEIVNTGHHSPASDDTIKSTTEVDHKRDHILAHSMAKILLAKGRSLLNNGYLKSTLCRTCILKVLSKEV